MILRKVLSRSECDDWGTAKVVVLVQADGENIEGGVLRQSDMSRSMFHWCLEIGSQTVLQEGGREPALQILFEWAGVS